MAIIFCKKHNSPKLSMKLNCEKVFFSFSAEIIKETTSICFIIWLEMDQNFVEEHYFALMYVVDITGLYVGLATFSSW